MNLRRVTRVCAIGLLAAATGLAVGVTWLNRALPSPFDVESARGIDTPELRQRGAYLARAANCHGCHTVPGGAAFAGGRPIATPFGTVYAGNLTPDDANGLGRWTLADFDRALRQGRSRDGRLLVPAFPFQQFMHLQDEDVRALFAWLRSQPAVPMPNRAHELRFPYGLDIAQALWRARYVTRWPLPPPQGQPGPAVVDARWQRGRYLVEVLGHCRACHAPRDALGGPHDSMAGGGGSRVGPQQWLAPSLHAAGEAGVADWTEDDIVALLQSGVSARGSALGPMAEVVFGSTQYLDDGDLRAMAHYLRRLPQAPVAAPAVVAAPEAALSEGARLYEKHCAACHGREGQGLPGAIAPLAGNRAVLMDSPVHVLTVLRHGGFMPTTALQPRPWGMPPFAGVLDAGQMASLASFIRQSWGNRAGAVSELDVLKLQ